MAGPTRFSRIACGALALIGVFLAAAPARADQDSTIRRLADIFAGSAVADGTAVGVGVGIVVGDRVRLFAYGDAVAASGAAPAVRFTPDTVFQIGSTTKVFTTNLLGQSVHRHVLRLDDTLTRLSAESGPLPGMRNVTLRNLGDFTAGLPQYAPLCTAPDTPPGCRPNGRPSLQQYDADDFLAFFRNFTAPPQPAPYNYSDFSTGLLGLLLGGSSPIDNHTVTGWFDAVKRSILDPLGMRSTFLYVPEAATGRVASGYQRALAQAVVSNGSVGGYKLLSRGLLYTSAPTVRVIGGGSGATAMAQVSAGQVIGLTPTATGSNYAPPHVTFTGSATAAATGRIVVSGGRVVGVKILKPGAGYTAAPTVAFSVPAQGRTARGVAHLALGHVSFVSIEDGGAGYQPPVSVLIGAPAASTNTIPVWAPAGALSSTIRDMAAFAQAALGHPWIGGRPIDPAILAGFRIAETPYACQGHDPDLHNCGPTTPRSGLAWQIVPADGTAGVPAIVVKDGGVGGFSSELRLMPARDMAVVVFANAREAAARGPTRTAENIADNLLYALYYSLPH